MLLLLPVMFLPLVTLATSQAVNSGGVATMGKYQMMRYVLLGMIVLFALIIIVMGNAVASAGKIYWEREKKKKVNAQNRILLLSFLATCTASISHAQEAAVLPHTAGEGIPKDMFLFVVIAALEFVIIMVLAYLLLKFLKTVPETNTAKASKHFSPRLLFQKLNSTVAVEDEHTIDLQHDYDGIRELDNKVPGWWRYAFYASIFFGVVYLYRMFVAETIPTQIQELKEANYVASIQKAEYLKHAANNVDENTVAMLDEAGIAEGAALFTKNCLACHGDKGQGGVGPNLTDEYWLHKGSLKDIFHSIKYGWPEKGMKAWKDDFSPGQIAQLSSYIKSIGGTHPAGGKEPQGEVYVESKTMADGKSVKAKL